MATITLDTGASSITIAAPKYPYEPGLNRPVVIGRTWGGGFKVADFGDGTDWDNPVLHFRAQSDSDHTSLQTFVLTTVNLSETAFTYTDPFGGSHTNMHYLRGIEDFQQRNGKWNGDIYLAKDMSA